MKILFLDIDGVMVTSSCSDECNKWGYSIFDPNCVVTLNYIVDKTGCEIVISSDWKNNFSLGEIREFFRYNNLISKPIGFTTNSNTYNGMNLESGRADEVNMWLKQHNFKDDDKFCIIDDLNMSKFFRGKFVHSTDNKVGISGEGIKENIISILNNLND